MSAGRQYTLAAGLIFVVAGLDVFTGTEVAVSIFYLLPVALLAWHGGWKAARVAVFACGLTWLISDIITGQEYSLQAIRYWNAVVRTGFFFIVGYTVSRLRASVEELTDLARRDTLTGVANSRTLFEVAEIEIARQRRYNQPLSIVFVDCDDFKEVNDRFGHAAGDELLKRIASTLQGSVRETDVVARIGGDEFAVLLPQSDAKSAQAVCSKARAVLTPAAEEQGVTLSMGVVTYLVPPQDVEEMLHTADQVMYEVKAAGKDAAGHRIIGGVVQENRTVVRREN